MKQPPVVGHWVLPGSTASHYMMFACYQKPFVIHRWFMKLLLGWAYRDEK